MKIIFPLLSLEHHGGTRDIVEIANYLVSKGHKVIVYVPENRFKRHYPLSRNVILNIVPISGKNRINQLLVLLWYLFFMERADLYVANFFPTFYPVFMRSIFGRSPFVYFIQDIESKFVSFPLNITALLTYILPSKKIALSNYIKKSLKSKHVQVARAGVSDIFLKKPPKMRFFTPPLTIGHILRKERLKNSKLFIKALPEIINFGYKVILVGDKKQVPYKDKRIKVIPYGNSEYLRDEFYDKIDIFVHTSLIEGFGLPPLEAMARGCVVLLTNSGGPEEYVTSENSIIIDKHDPQVLVSKLCEISKKPELLRTISQNGVKTAKHHPLSRLGKEFEIALLHFHLLK